MAPIVPRHRPQRPFRLAGQPWMRPLRSQQKPGGNSPSFAIARQPAFGRRLCRIALSRFGSSRARAASPVSSASFKSNTGCRSSHGLLDEPELSESIPGTLDDARRRHEQRSQARRTPCQDRELRGLSGASRAARHRRAPVRPGGQGGLATGPAQPPRRSGASEDVSSGVTIPTSKVAQKLVSELVSVHF